MAQLAWLTVVVQSLVWWERVVPPSDVQTYSPQRLHPCHAHPRGQPVVHVWDLRESHELDPHLDWPALGLRKPVVEFHYIFKEVAHGVLHAVYEAQNWNR